MIERVVPYGSEATLTINHLYDPSSSISKILFSLFDTYHFSCTISSPLYLVHEIILMEKREGSKAD